MLTCLPPSTIAQSVSPPPAREPPPGEGVICAWAIYTTVAEVGGTCFPRENPALQAELRRSVSRIDAYVLRNSKGATPEQLTAFKRQQGHVGAPAARLCVADAIQLYRSLEKAGAAKLSAGVDAMLARDGEPTWGTCL